MSGMRKSPKARKSPKSKNSPESKNSMANEAAENAVVPVDRAPLPLARLLHQICIAATADILVPERLTNPHFGVLTNLSRATGKPGIDQVTLAARMVIDRARASQLVDDLESMGLVERSINGADRRARMLWLTPHGERVRARLYPAVRAGQMSALAALSARERKLLLDLLVRVVKAGSKLARPGAGRRKRGFRQSTGERKRAR
jgi:DNA-binding MarR family transcriptional regulator